MSDLPVQPIGRHTDPSDAKGGNHLQGLGRWIAGPWSIALALAFVILGIAFAGGRAYQRYSQPDGTFDLAKSGMSDFHNGVYLPSLAFREGANPYSLEVCEPYQLARSAPPYSPVVFMLYSPLTWLSLEQADVVYFGINVLLLGLIAWFSLRMSGASFQLGSWLWIWGLVIFSRPGHITLFTGYFTAQLVIGSLMAIHFSKSRPWLAGVGMLLASGKPTYILPLTLLMLFRRDYKAVAIGLVLCTIGGSIGIGWLASHSSLGDVVAGVREGQAAFDDDPSEFPVNTWTRLDTVGVVSKVMAWKPDNRVYFGTMIALLIGPGIAIWRIAPWEKNRGATGLSGMIVSLAMLIAIYHHSYDCLLVVAAWVGVTFFGSRVCPELRIWERVAMCGLLAIPAGNYISTLRFREWLGVGNQSVVWNVVASINGACLLMALIVLLVAALRVRESAILSSRT